MPVRSVVRSIFYRYTAALEFRDYRRMWLANLSAQSAAWALIVARGWFVYEEHQMSSEVGLVTFAATAPAFIIPPIAGVLADRIDRRKLLAASYLLNLAVNLVMAVLALLGMLQVWEVFVLSLLNGAARYTQMPVTQALAANLVPRERLLNALSLTAATNNFARLAGAALVTPLLGLTGVHVAFFLCTALYGVGFLQVMQIKSLSRIGAVARDGFVQNFLDGLRYIKSQPLIAMVIVLVCFHCGLTMAFESTLPAFSRQSLNTGTGGFGILMTAVGIGALVGSLGVGGISSALGRGRMFLATGILSGLGIVMLAFAPSMPLAYVAAMIMGCTQAAFMTMGQAVTQALAADEYRGRVASVNTLSLQGLMSLMNLANGMLTDTYSASVVLATTGGAFVVVMLLSFLVATPREVYLRGLPEHAMLRSAARPG